LYGGSVNSTNAGEYLEERHIDGLLVGGASLLPDDFNKIIG
jgi:triosephosphate isomerase (TIM)